jgi:hypothetical protein
MLTVVDEASSYDLATLAVVKAALGLTGGEEDATLSALITRASAAIAKYCNRVFAQETIEESFRVNAVPSCWRAIPWHRSPASTRTAPI